MGTRDDSDGPIPPVERMARKVLPVVGAGVLVFSILVLLATAYQWFGIE